MFMNRDENIYFSTIFFLQLDDVKQVQIFYRRVKEDFTVIIIEIQLEFLPFKHNENLKFSTRFYKRIQNHKKSSYEVL